VCIGDRKTVLAGKGSLPPRREATRPCRLRAVLQPENWYDGRLRRERGQDNRFREQSLHKILDTAPFRSTRITQPTRYLRGSVFILFVCDSILTDHVHRSVQKSQSQSIDNYY
jgi:hypothetical protein